MNKTAYNPPKYFGINHSGYGYRWHTRVGVNRKNKDKQRFSNGGSANVPCNKQRSKIGHSESSTSFVFRLDDLVVL